MSDEKVGNFEWIVSYDHIKPFINDLYNSYTSNENDDIEVFDDRKLRVLEIGCGTSTISQKLVLESFIDEVISIDNDENCIMHLREQYEHKKQESKSLKWFVYDIVEYTGIDADIMRNENESFDLIVDKGTLDAILVEGSISNMLIEINRLLKLGGAYLVCSLHSKDILGSLLTMKALGYDVSLHETGGSMNMNDSNKNILSTSTMTGTIGLCKKVSNNSINLTKLEQEELEIMNYYYQQKTPLLTIEKETEIYSLYESSYRKNNTNNDNDNNWELTYSISVDEAYMIMFNAEDRIDYTYSLFLEDLVNFTTSNESSFTYTEAIDFLKTMQ